MLKKLIVLLPFAIFLFGCSSVPKGPYSRSKIDRPYAMPDDVARFSFGATSAKAELEDASDSASGEIESDENVLPMLAFEHGIGETTSWVYPIGIRWQIMQSGSHTLGFSGSTFFFVNALSLDYWLRLGDQVSLRPFIRAFNYDLIFVEEQRSYGGLELLFQVTPNLALGLSGSHGTFKSRSRLIEEIVTGISGDEDFDTTVTGKLDSLGLSANFSLSDYWDLDLTYEFGKHDADEFDIATRSASIYATVYY